MHGFEIRSAEHLGMDVRRVHKWVGANHHRWYSAVLQGHGVVHTARGAGSSISNGRHNEIAPLRQPVHDLSRRRSGIDELVEDDGIPKLIVLFQ